jgi:hypothetical protein
MKVTVKAIKSEAQRLWNLAHRRGSDKGTRRHSIGLVRFSAPGS